ncbi:hypothetical protein B9Q17_06440 [Marinobacter vinifirmus]|uniref:DUF4194 domain-containing protein n=1 Tax=Marinobacter vinifirmus TaxID=355591 RepID=A0A7Z1DSD0_9GAMM|nr:hypothetical protein [Marinobacter vinifirmus]OZC35134.1 hypothetical protein B9Q17_06440 [Marinobacter vinifirmus]
MQNNPLFEQTVTALLGGKIICEYNYSDLYNYLSLPNHQQKVADFLQQMNRTLRQTSSHDAWLCAYNELNTPDAQAAVRQQFRDATMHFEALVQFLRLHMMVEASQRPIAPGEEVREGQLLERISSAPSLEAKLRSLTTKQPFKTTRTDSAGQIRMVMTRLVEDGYLKQVGTSGSVYQATAKWSWLYDLMTFIKTHEGIRDDSDEEDPQMRLA